LSKKLTN